MDDAREQEAIMFQYEITIYALDQNDPAGRLWWVNLARLSGGTVDCTTLTGLA